MVYEKYIKKDGKKFGPYYYESYRGEDGKVKTRFIGTTNPELTPLKSRNILYASLFIGIILLAIFAGFYYLKITDSHIISNTFSSVNYGISNVGHTLYSFITGRTVEESDNPQTITSEPQTPASSDVSQPTTTETSAETPTETAQETPSEITPETPSESAPAEIPAEMPVEPLIAPTPETPTEEPIAEPNQTFENTTTLAEIININNATNNESSAPVQESIINETIAENISTQITIKQYSAVIGKPVKWEKKVKIENAPAESNQPINIELPSLAGNVSVTKVDAETGNSQDITQNAVIRNEKILEEIQPITSITGNVIAGYSNTQNGIITRIFNFFSNLFNSFISLTGKIIDDLTSGSENNVTVSVSMDAGVTRNDEVIVEYYTDAPYSEETLVDNSKKEITIVGPDVVHYQDVLAYSELPVEVKDASKIKLYWTSSDSGEKEEVNFEAQDTNGNGLIDTIQWVVPHLSNQTYEIILITKAQHLDSNRTEISDIYDYVKTQDSNWSETIANGEFVRVTFEQALDNTRDITIVAKANCNNSIRINDINVPCEVYYKKLRLEELRGGNG